MAEKKRYVFILKGKRTHTIISDSEANARAFFAENPSINQYEIIDVLEENLVVAEPYKIAENPDVNVHTYAEIKPHTFDATPPAGSIKVGY
ncbi:hypothetical protein EBU71_00325 [bacterium]|nr:hypothetical protein [Candidatus Elulimicrobium humile]